MLKVIVNGQLHPFAEGTTILAACHQLGIEVPTLCHDDRLKPSGACRLCIVNVKGSARPATACNTTLTDGMEVQTHSTEVEELRHTLLKLLAQNYPAEAVELCPEKDFHRWLRHYHISVAAGARTLTSASIDPFQDSTHPYLHADFSQCITCYRCVRICDEVQGQFVWRAWNRGDRTRIAPEATTLSTSQCVSCGACADTCPTGAIEDQSVLQLGRPLKWTRTTCPYCGVGCEMMIGTRDNRIVQVKPALDAPVNKGHLCVKGRYAFAFTHAADRITQPMIRVNGSVGESGAQETSDGSFPLTPALSPEEREKHALRLEQSGRSRPVERWDTIPPLHGPGRVALPRNPLPDNQGGAAAQPYRVYGHKARTNVSEDSPPEGEGRGEGEQGVQVPPPGWKFVTWPEAIACTAKNLQRIAERYGPDSVGVLGSARGTNEENYLAQKFARVVLGTNNVDCCARVCHAPTAAAMKAMLGTGAATNSFDDIEQARAFLLCGTNATENHPIIGARIKQAVLRGAKLIVIDPRQIELARYADIHLPLKPGTNVPLLNALACAMVEEKLFDDSAVRERVSEWEEFQRFILRFAPEKVAELCGVDGQLIREAARLYATTKPAMCFHGLGMTEHTQGTEGVMCLVNLALLTGNFGKPGSGVNPLRGQNNVQGSAHMGCEPNHLTGFINLSPPNQSNETLTPALSLSERERENRMPPAEQSSAAGFAERRAAILPLLEGEGRGEVEPANANSNPEDPRALFESVWRAPLPKTKGLNLMQMMDAAGEGALKALWAIGYDVLLTNPNAHASARSLKSLEFVIVQDMFLNELARECGSVFLPVASSFEREGTFMNSERRVQRVRKAVEPPGQAKPDWEIICDIARAMGKGELFDFHSPEEIWEEIRAVWKAGHGITYPRLAQGGLQWPCPTEDHPGTTMLHAKTFSSGPRAPLKRIEFNATRETISAEFPFLLITGRTLYHFNAGTMTMRTANADLRPTDTLDISREDAERLVLIDDEEVRVRSRHGEAVLPAPISAAVKPGELFATFHTNHVFLNRVTGLEYDTITDTPEYKITAVRVERVTTGGDTSR